MSLRSQSMPCASIFAHCAAVSLIDRCSSFASGGAGGRPRGRFGSSITSLYVMQKTLALSYLLNHNKHIKQPEFAMTADQVRALVSKQFPQAMQSPLAQLFGNVAARDEADRAIDFAGLQASFTAAQDKEMLAEAMEHARQCIEACEAAGVAYDGCTLSHNIESNFPDLDPDECDEIARVAIANYGSAS